MSVRRVALLTAGGFAPCLSSAVGGLIERYNEMCANGYDDDFRKSEKYLWPVQDGPFYDQRMGIGLCLTTFLQATILIAGLMVVKDHALLGLGLMLSSGDWNTTQSPSCIVNSTSSTSVSYRM